MIPTIDWFKVKSKDYDLKTYEEYVRTTSGNVFAKLSSSQVGQSSRTEYIRNPDYFYPQFLLNFFSYKHARKLGHNSMERWDP